MFFQQGALPCRDFAVRRPEQIGFKVPVAFFYIKQVIIQVGSPAVNMAVGVISDAVATPENFGKQFGVFSNIVAHTKECGLGIVLIQQVEHPWGYFRFGAVVKSQVDFIMVCLYTPEVIGKI